MGTDTHGHGAMPWEHEGRDWSNVFTYWRIPRIDSTPVLVTPWSQTFNLLNHETIICYCLSHLVCEYSQWIYSFFFFSSKFTIVFWLFHFFMIIWESTVIWITIFCQCLKCSWSFMCSWEYFFLCVTLHTYFLKNIKILWF